MAMAFPPASLSPNRAARPGAAPPPKPTAITAASTRNRMPRPLARLTEIRSAGRVATALMARTSRSRGAGSPAPPLAEHLGASDAPGTDSVDGPDQLGSGDEHDDERLDHRDDVGRDGGDRLHLDGAQVEHPEQQSRSHDPRRIRPPQQRQGDGVEAKIRREARGQA